MPTLNSEEKDRPSSLTIKPGDFQQLRSTDENQRWQQVFVELISGRFRKVETSGSEDSLLCRTPEDEIQTLIDNLQALTSREKERVLFEPSEPSFEISFERTARGGIKVETWIDAGNGDSGFYTWDAAGIRFYTNDELLVSFISELRKAFFPLPGART